jgi:hypothetical protein
MRSNLFREGGQYKIQRTGTDNYTMTVPLPTDAEGRLGRECPSDACSPGYFKVKGGTGIVGGQTVVYCPYCRGEAEPSDYTTKAQIEYARQVMRREAHEGIGTMMREALGIGPSGTLTLGGGMLKVSLSMEQSSPPSVHRPFEQALQRIVICPHCGLDHAVFGLAVWCSDCGADIFLTHVKAELDVVKMMLGDIPRRQRDLGDRIAARDIENSLEDIVSIYEAVLRALFVRCMRQRGMSELDLQALLTRKVANRFQNVRLAADVMSREIGVSLYAGIPEPEIEAFAEIFEKRHPITHNLGVVDRKYLDRVRTAECEGSEIGVSPHEITTAMDTVLKVVSDLHSRLFLAPLPSI